MRRYLFALLLGLGGIAILVSLGTWQVRRLAWKEALLSDIAARMAAPAVPLAAVFPVDAARDQYRPVTVSGVTGDDVLVLSGRKDSGPGYQVVTVLATDDGRRVLLDRGFIPEEARAAARPATHLEVEGNLYWPGAADSFTPAPDKAGRLWFATDIGSMSQFLQTEPVLVVTRRAAGQDPAIAPAPVDTAGIPNDHRNYAITWFSLAVVWAGMTGFLLWRIRHRTD